MDNTLFYENLANAIIVQAAKDYVKELKVLKKHPDYTAALARKKEIERFFHSEWFKQLTKLKGDYLISQLEMAVNA